MAQKQTAQRQKNTRPAAAALPADGEGALPQEQVPATPVFTNTTLQHQAIQMQRIQNSVAQREEKKNTTGMPDNLKSGIENLSGLSMDDVKVHYNSPKPAQLNALAYAQGTDIHVASGQEKHLPHEAWHIVQQKQGRVKPTLQMKTGTPVNDDPGLETEADVMGARALQMMPAQRKTPQQRNGTARTNTVQREEEPNAADLYAIITELRKSAEAAKDGEGADALNEQIAILEEILDSGDTTQIAATVIDLKAEIEKNSEELGKGQQPSSGGEKDVVQGMFGLGFLIAAVSWVLANPIKTIVLAAVVERVVAKVKRKKLPPRIGAMVFRDDRMTYFFLVKRKINLFKRANNLSDHDEEELKRRALEGIRVPGGENNYLYNVLPDLLLNNLGQYQAPNMAALLGPNAINLSQSIFTDIGNAIPKTLAHPNVDSDTKPHFTRALRKMPFVKSLYKGDVHDNTQLSRTAFKKKKLTTTKWKNGGALTNSIQEVDDGYQYITKDRRQVDDGTFGRKVKEAEHFVLLALEPEVLALVPRPTVMVHLRNQKSKSNPFGFRAFQRNGEIHVAQDEDQSVIVHELGHYIENNLPISNWIDIRLLLQGRNNNQQKGSYIYPQSYSEQRFGGEYPATGKYTSKYYEDGATEVTSMSTEYLAHPEKFRTLIESDPQQAAIILRLLRPNEYARTGALRAYDMYLPH